MRGTNPRGLITDDLFYRILEKLTREFPRWQLHYYNWTEPLIHPRIVEYTRAAAQAGFHLHLSSNLNYLKDAEGLMAAGAKTFRISLSGFTQDIYKRGHRGGDIEKVKRNMQVLSKARQSTGSRTRVHVYFHKYRHNLHELSAMEVFARDLGFDFVADWAYLMPVEKLLAYIDGRLPDDEQDFADQSILPNPRDAAALMQPYRARSCELIEQLVLDFQGRVSLCCASYDSKRNFIADYLESDWSSIQDGKRKHELCGPCMKQAAHVLFTHFSKPDLRSQIESLADAHLQQSPKATHAPSLRLPILHQHPLAESA